MCIRDSAQTEGYIIFLANLQDLIEMFKERVFKTGHFHPGEDDGTASWNDICQPLCLFEAVCRIFIDADIDVYKRQVAIAYMTGILERSVRPFITLISWEGTGPDAPIKAKILENI